MTRNMLHDFVLFTEEFQLKNSKLNISTPTSTSPVTCELDDTISLDRQLSTSTVSQSSPPPSSSPVKARGSGDVQGRSEARLSAIYLYPVKSCSAFQVREHFFFKRFLSGLKNS